MIVSDNGLDDGVDGNTWHETGVRNADAHLEGQDQLQKDWVVRGCRKGIEINDDGKKRED